jgi:hypothetical protein
MSPLPRHRPHRSFPAAPRRIVACAFGRCLHCDQPLQPRKPWHMRKTIQTLQGPLFVAGKSKECTNPTCSHAGQHYYASTVWTLSLPFSTYGLDVLAFIGWQHDHEHRQLVEIQHLLNKQSVLINERTVGKLYRQFLALLAGEQTGTQQRLVRAAAQHGGLVWAVDALQPEGHGTLLYLLYEVLSDTPVAAIQLPHASGAALSAWLAPYALWPFAVLGTLSDGDEAIGVAFRACWPQAPHQLCQVHFLNNLAEPVLEVDHRFRQQLRQTLGDLPPVPTQPPPLGSSPAPLTADAFPP